jgi:hypothetical protein
MRNWVQTIEETTPLFSPIGLRLIDDLTGNAPLGRMEVFLDFQDAQGAWKLTGINAVISASGVVTYPGLEHHANATGLPARQYRVRLKPDFYVPLYQRNQDGIPCIAFPYDNSHPPQTIKKLPDDTILTPAPGYPFQGHIPVARGIVVDLANKAVPNAVVTQGVKEKVLTDGRGVFALPLRWAVPGTQIPIDAANERTGRTGTTPIQFPADLSRSIRIQIN